jgi:CheY-like chemotaxis protein
VIINPSPTYLAYASPVPQEEFAAETLLTGVRVLVVDDAEEIRFLLARMLGLYGATVSFAVNGKLGGNLALRSHFEVVLMDIQMPILDGYEAMVRLRKCGYQGLVIALTANATKDEIERCFVSGFDAYLAKTFELVALRDLVLHCANHALQHQSEKSARTTPLCSSHADEREWSDSFADCAELVVRKLPQHLKTLHAFAVTRDWFGIRRLAHQLRGSCWITGFEALSRVMGEIEMEAAAEYPREDRITAALQQAPLLGKRIE